jgi:hypothetical protein
MIPYQGNEIRSPNTADHASTSHISEESRAYWRPIVAAMSPMTAEEIADVGAVIRRIEDRRARDGQCAVGHALLHQADVMTSQVL